MQGDNHVMKNVIKKHAGIYWLASYPRSGNTWVRMFLRAFINGECDINDMDDVVLGKDSELQWQATSASPIANLTGQDRLDYLFAVYRNFIYIANGNNVRIKTHDANAIANDKQLIPKHLTKGGVYLVRDPRDVACSYAAYKGVTIDEAITLMEKDDHQIGFGESYAWHFLGNWSFHVQTWASEGRPPNVVTVRYEDLVGEHQISAFSGILQAMGFEGYEDLERVKNALEETEFAKLRKQEENQGFDESDHRTGNFFRKGKTGSWREELTEEQVERIERSHGEVMEAMNYELTTGEYCGTTNEAGSAKATG